MNESETRETSDALVVGQDQGHRILVEDHWRVLDLVIRWIVDDAMKSMGAAAVRIEMDEFDVIDVIDVIEMDELSEMDEVEDARGKGDVTSELEVGKEKGMVDLVRGDDAPFSFLPSRPAGSLGRVNVEIA